MIPDRTGISITAEQKFGWLDLVRWSPCKCGCDLAYIGDPGWNCAHCQDCRHDLNRLGAGPPEHGDAASPGTR